MSSAVAEAGTGTTMRREALDLWPVYWSLVPILSSLGPFWSTNWGHADAGVMAVEENGRVTGAGWALLGHVETTAAAVLGEIDKALEHDSHKNGIVEILYQLEAALRPLRWAAGSLSQRYWSGGENDVPADSAQIVDDHLAQLKTLFAEFDAICYDRKPADGAEVAHA